MREGVRFGRLLNVAIGLSVAVGPWLVEGSSKSFISCTMSPSDFAKCDQKPTPTHAVERVGNAQVP